MGVGGFHRAHMAVYVDSILARANMAGWSICGVGLLPADLAMRDALASQDYLYTVLERGAAKSRARVVGAISGYLHAPSDPEAVLAKLADPSTHIVSMTITESGYFVNEATGGLDLHHPDIAADLLAPRAVKTIYGYLCTALERRRKAGLAPFTVMSCDNVQHNGDLTRRMVLAFAREQNAELAAWIDAHGAFPNSMVDRITPRTTDADRTDLKEHFGIDDAWPVVTEPFSQWVMEDRFSDGSPPWGEVGVQLVADVNPYEMMKLRLLNGSHSAMAYLGFLCGHLHVHEVIADPTFHRYIRGMMAQEVVPRLPEIPGIDLNAYCETLLVRFANPAIADQVARLCQDGSGKLPKFILPSAQIQITKRGPMRRLALCVAAWMRYLTGVDEQGIPYTVLDPMVGQLQPLAKQGLQNPRAVLAVPGLFPPELRESEAFIQEVGEALKSLYERGAKATLALYAE